VDINGAMFILPPCIITTIAILTTTTIIVFIIIVSIDRRLGAQKPSAPRSGKGHPQLWEKASDARYLVRDQSFFVLNRFYYGVDALEELFFFFDKRYPF